MFMLMAMSMVKSVAASLTCLSKPKNACGADQPADERLADLQVRDSPLM